MLSQVLQPFWVMSAAAELVADQTKGSVKMRHQCRVKIYFVFYFFFQMGWTGRLLTSLYFQMATQTKGSLKYIEVTLLYHCSFKSKVKGA